MNAQELTIVMNEVTNNIQDMKCVIEYLQQRVDKLEIRFNDLSIDFKMEVHKNNDKR